MRVAIIPARGGSRRIPRKNIRPFHGKPIIAYSIAVAQASGLFDAIYVSTDDDEIASVANGMGVPVHKRCAEMSRDEVGTQAVMKYALTHMLEIGAFLTRTPDYACCIYPTAPLMFVSDIVETHDWLLSSGLNYTYIEGWLYWGHFANFVADVPLNEFVGTWKPARRWIDINTEADWHRAEQMYADLHGVIS